MKTPLYVIVHPAVVEGLAKANEDYGRVWTEIKRIQEEGNCILCKGNHDEIISRLPSNRETTEIRVCGAFSGKEERYVVDVTCKILRAHEYNAVVYGPGTVLL